MLITVDYGGGGKNCQNIDYVICERPLIKNVRFKKRLKHVLGVNHCTVLLVWPTKILKGRSIL